MIIRELLDDPNILDCFDFFNDTDDTVNWLRGFARDVNVHTPEGLARAERAEVLAVELERRSKVYLAERHAAFRREHNG